MHRLTFAIALLALSGCTLGSALREDAKLIDKRIKSARERGSYRCAPTELALAESHLEFLEYELTQGDFQRASYHRQLALRNISEALDITDPNECADKNVLISSDSQVVIKNVDRDGDGILDAQDQCPDEAEDFDKYEDVNGCPDPDNDSDTVLDINDQCPLEPGDPLNQGCPLPDRDGDGIPDESDLCPDQPEDFDGNEDGDGCPEEENLDVDEDGILNDVDQCPEDPEDKDNFEDEDGCPEPDNDQDGVLDIRDICPDIPGPIANQGCPVSDRDGDSIQDDIDQCPDVPGSPPSGCPKRVLVEKTDKEIKIKKKINFRTDTAVIEGDLSFEIIFQVAAVLKSNPTIKVVVEGHTDSNGPADYNLRLSDLRANAVKDELIKRGTDKSRLEAIGYGETKPIASNRRQTGRATNRRVQFRIVEEKATVESDDDEFDLDDIEDIE